MKTKFALKKAALAVFLTMISIGLLAQKDSLKKHHLLFFPVIASSVETGFAFGGAGSLTFQANKNDTITRTSNLQMLALYSTKKQFVSAINGTQYFNKEKYILMEQLSYSSFPDKFWGLGKNSVDAAEEPYQFQQFYLYLHLLRKVAPHLFVGSIYEYQNVWNIKYIPGGLFDQENIAGRYGYKVSGLGASITYDTRNNAFAPDKGVYAQFYFNHFNKIFGSDFNFTNYVLDARKFFSLTKNQILAFQLYSFNGSGNEIPIRSLAALGGASRMRGYYEGRFRDYQLLVLQSEYRLKLSKRFGMVAFGALGNVSSEFKYMGAEKLKYSYGAGLRFALNKTEKLNIRVDYGLGEGINKGFYLQIGEAF